MRRGRQEPHLIACGQSTSITFACSVVLNYFVCAASGPLRTRSSATKTPPIRCCMTDHVHGPSMPDECCDQVAYEWRGEMRCRYARVILHQSWFRLGVHERQVFLGAPILLQTLDFSIMLTPFGHRAVMQPCFHTMLAKNRMRFVQNLRWVVGRSTKRHAWHTASRI